MVMLFHVLLWMFCLFSRERRCGGIAPGFEVRHKNGITVGKRYSICCILLDNLKGGEVAL